MGACEEEQLSNHRSKLKSQTDTWQQQEEDEEQEEQQQEVAASVVPHPFVIAAFAVLWQQAARSLASASASAIWLTSPHAWLVAKAVQCRAGGESKGGR